MTDFQSLGVAKWLVESLDVMAIHQPSAIQAACIPPILEGKLAQLFTKNTTAQ
jgi:ATP-dependent RNA helicase DDX49/DBP8